MSGIDGSQQFENAHTENSIDGVRPPNNRFIFGVVEGFYGRPWVSEQRRSLFRLMKHLGMNTYIYAPKDDVKHRAEWRQLYTPEESDNLLTLIDAAKIEGIEFIYALSPGLDMIYSKEMKLVRKKLQQVQRLGCEAFALLFDDIEPSMNAADKEHYSSFAAAHVHVANDAYEALGAPARFLFCPTEYCESRAVPNLADSEYLNTLGAKLLPAIEILWTGPRVVPKTISVKHIEKVALVLKRRPLLWDNLHANDYDQRRVFVGAYMGRPVGLRSVLSGVLSNPNCEFEANFVPLHTMADWYCSDADAQIEDSTAAVFEADGVESVVVDRITSEARPTLLYHPVKSLERALAAWLLEFQTPRNAFGITIPVKNIDISCSKNDHDTDASGSLQVELSQNNPLGNPPAIPLTPLTLTFPHVEANSSDTVTIQDIQNEAADSTDNEGVSNLPLYTSFAAGDKCRAATGVSETNEPAIAAVASTHSALPPDPMPPLDPMFEAGIISVNSLTAEYSEPMDLAPSAVLNAKASGDNVDVTAKSDSEVVMMDAGGVSDSSPGVSPSKCEDEAMIVEGDATNNSGCELKHLALIADLFCLPFSDGRSGRYLMEEFGWLTKNASVVGTARMENNEKLSAEWHRRANAYSAMCDLVSSALWRLVRTRNRAIVYDFYPYLWEMESVTSVLKALLQWLALGPQPPHYPLANTAEDRRTPIAVTDGEVTPGSDDAVAATSEIPSSETEKQQPSSTSVTEPVDSEVTDPEPWVYRGGLVGCLQKMAVGVGAVHDLFMARPPHPPADQLLKIRPMHEQDKEMIYKLAGDQFSSTVANGSTCPDSFAGDCCFGGYLSCCSSYAFVMEVSSEDANDNDNDRQMIGFVFAAPNAVGFIEHCRQHYLPTFADAYPTVDPSTTVIDWLSDFAAVVPPSLLEQTPGMLTVRCSEQFLESAAPRRLIATLLIALRKTGTRDVLATVAANDSRQMDLYCKLGFLETTSVSSSQKHVIMCRPT